MKKIKEKIYYYFWATYRRKLLDKFQEKYRYLYHGIVLDIGGRDRGKFIKPRDKVEKWIFADIEIKHEPDIVLDVTNMSQIANESIDVVNAIELFEHVQEPELGLKECYRILKKGGVLILSAPFLYPVHADPYDFQRWTKYKWNAVLNGIGYKDINIEITGFFFVVLADMLRVTIKSWPRLFRYFGYVIYPLFDILFLLDELVDKKKSKIFNSYQGGYYIICYK